MTRKLFSLKRDDFQYFSHLEENSLISCLGKFYSHQTGKIDFRVSFLRLSAFQNILRIFKTSESDNASRTREDKDRTGKKVLILFNLLEGKLQFLVANFIASDTFAFFCCSKN